MDHQMWYLHSGSALWLVVAFWVHLMAPYSYQMHHTHCQNCTASLAVALPVCKEKQVHSMYPQTNKRVFFLFFWGVGECKVYQMSEWKLNIHAKYR